MLNMLTGDDLFAHILLLRVTDARAILLLEGPVDCKTLDAHLNEVECRSLPANGKNSVLRATELAVQNGVPDVLGVLDQDVDGRPGAGRAGENLIYVGAHDLDTLILHAPSVFARVCTELASVHSINRHVARLGLSSALEVVHAASRPISELRTLSVTRDLRLALGGFPVEVVVDAERATVDLAAMVDLAIKRSKGQVVLRADEVEAALRLSLADAFDPINDLNGHDMHAVLAFVAKEAWGANVKTGAELVSRLARAAFSCGQLMVTDLFDRVAEWGRDRGRAIWSCPACYA